MADSAQRLLSCKGGDKPSLVQLRALAAQLAAARLAGPQHQALAVAIERTDSVQQRAKACLRMRAPMGELQALVAEAGEVAGAVPEVKQLQELIERAQAWQQRAAQAQPTSQTLKELRLLLHSGGSAWRVGWAGEGGAAPPLWGGGGGWCSAVRGVGGRFCLCECEQAHSRAVTLGGYSSLSPSLALTLSLPSRGGPSASPLPDYP